MDAMEYIRETYGVPAKRGMRVEYTGYDAPELGTITSATHSGHLKIRLDRFKRSMRFHPTWKLQYLPATTPEGGA